MLKLALLILAVQDETRPVALAALADGGIAVVDPVKGRLIRRIEGLSDATFGIAVNPAQRSQAWAVGEKTGQLFQLDLSAWAVKGAPIAIGGPAHQPVTTADGRFVLVTVPGDNTLTIVDARTRAVSKIAMPHDPHIVDIDPRTDHVFVSRRGAERGATFLDFAKVRAKFDLSKGVTLTGAEAGALPIPISGAPRVITALGSGRFAIAMYGKRGPLIYQVKDGKAALVDDLDNLTTVRPRAAKANLEYLEAQAVSADGRTLVGTDQGVPALLRVWDLDADGRGVRERSIELPAEPYWVNLSADGRTAWVTIPKQGETGRVLTIDVASGRMTASVAIDDDGKRHTPKRMVVVDLPSAWVGEAHR